MSRVAVVTGSNKGLGLAIVKSLCQKFGGVVYLTSRDDRRGREAVAELNKLVLTPEYYQLDVNDRDSIVRFGDHIKEKHGGLDILVNNAGIADSNGKDFSHCTYEDAVKVINTNYKSVLTIEDLLYPLVRNNGRILNISSNCGHLSNLRNKYWIERLSKKDVTVQDINEFVDWYLHSKQNGTFNTEDFTDGGTISAYRVAKIALSAVTMVQQKRVESRNISINSMHPGIVQTDMTAGQGYFSPEQAAECSIYILLEAPQSLKGSYVWHDKEVKDWYDIDADYYFTVQSLLECAST